VLVPPSELPTSVPCVSPGSDPFGPLTVRISSFELLSPVIPLGCHVIWNVNVEVSVE
jgi:hypothetical protein